MKRMAAVIVLVCALLHGGAMTHAADAAHDSGVPEPTPPRIVGFVTMASNYVSGSPEEQEAAFAFLYLRLLTTTNTYERAHVIRVIASKPSDRAVNVLMHELMEPTSGRTEKAAILMLAQQHVNAEQLRQLLDILERRIRTEAGSSMDCMGYKAGFLQSIARAGGPDAFPVLRDYFTSPTLASRLTPGISPREHESAVLAATNSPLAIDHIMDRLANADFTTTYPARYDLYPLTQTASRQAREFGLPPETTAKVWDLFYRVANMPEGAPELKNVAFMGMAQLARATKHVQGLDYLAQARPQWENGMFSDRIETILEHPDQ